MGGEWNRLVDELNCWADHGLTVRMWLRDDDACALSQPLWRLREMARNYDIAAGLAVIPGLLQEDLSNLLAEVPREFFPMCHGWKHVNHGTIEKPCEFGGGRPKGDILADAKLAFDRFQYSLGGTRVFFVPPYNCLDESVANELIDIGFAGVSRGPTLLEARLAKIARTFWIPSVAKIHDDPMVPRVNAHIDVIDWRRKTAKTVERIVNDLMGYLRLRRRGFIESTEPIGILTHHLDHDELVWRLCHELLDRVRHHPSVHFFDLAAGLKPNGAPSRAR